MLTLTTLHLSSPSTLPPLPADLVLLGAIFGCTHGTSLLAEAALAGVRLVAMAIWTHRKTKGSHRLSAMLSLHRQISVKVVKAVAQLVETGGKLWELIYLVKASTKLSCESWVV